MTLETFNLKSAKKFFSSATGRLTMTYLAIIMVMCLVFSAALYHASSKQLNRQLPPRALFEDNDSITGFDTPLVRRREFNNFLRQRIDEGRHAILGRLALRTCLALAGGSLLSYYLARKNLLPIEAAMDAQSRFVSDASHELRTPLTALQTTNEVALRKLKLTGSEARELIEHNIAETKKLKQLTDGLLILLSAPHAAVPNQPVPLIGIAAEAMNMVVEAASAKNIEINDSLPDITVRGDNAELIRLATILLDNAVKYGRKNGHINLSARVQGKSVYFAVEDDGIGIKASDIPHLFERFYRSNQARTKSNSGGYGLGLSIAQQIAARHGGEIKVKSVPDKGSTFTVRLSLY